MLEQLYAMHREVVILAVPSKLLTAQGAVFTDGNAASEDTRFFDNTSYLSQLHWDVINSAEKKTTDEDRRIKCAEALVFPKVEAEDIKKVFCKNLLQRKEVLGQLPSELFISLVQVNQELFYFAK